MILDENNLKCKKLTEFFRSRYHTNQFDKIPIIVEESISKERDVRISRFI
jgi:hypothetical protein